MNNKLEEPLYNIECKKQFDLLMKQYIKKENITKGIYLYLTRYLKSSIQNLWISFLNLNIHKETVRITMRTVSILTNSGFQHQDQATYYRQ